MSENTEDIICFILRRSDSEVTSVFVKCVLSSIYRLSIAQKLLRSDFWTTGDRNIAFLLARGFDCDACTSPKSALRGRSVMEYDESASSFSV